MADDRSIYTQAFDWLTGDEPKPGQPPAKQDNRTFVERFSDWWKKPKTAPKPYINPKTGKPVRATAPIDPRTGRRTGTPESLTFREFLSNNWANAGLTQSLEAVREFIRSVPNMPRETAEGLMAAMSAYRGMLGSGMSDSQYYDLLLKPRTGDPIKDAYLEADFGGARPTRAQMQNIRRQDQRSATALANQFTYRDPKTGSVNFDITGMVRDASQDPAGTGVAILQTVRSGGTYAGKKLIEKAATKLPGTGVERALRYTGNVLNATGKTAGAAAIVANPIVPATSAVLRSTPVRSGMASVKRAVTGRQPVYSAEFRKEWEPYKKSYEYMLREGNGLTDDQIKSPEVQRLIYNEFQNETGGRFADPFKPEISAAMRENGMDPVQYGLPDRAEILETTFYKKKGVTPDILREAEMRVGGAENVTFSAATGEPPSRFFGRNEKAARETTEAQMSGAFSNIFAPPEGARAPTLQDVTDDFIRSNVGRRNAAQADYNAAARSDGVYQDPNAFIDSLDQQITQNMLSRGIDPRELSTNSDKFGSANTVAASLRRNIANHASYTPPIQGLGADGRMYTYNRETNGWFNPEGQPAAPGQVSFLNQTVDLQRQLASAPPAPVNKLSLENLDIERRNLNAAAERAYQMAVGKTGDFREYNAIVAMRDAIDDTAINMADTFTGDARAAVPHLQSARANFREWRANGIDSNNPVIRQAAQAIDTRTVFDPETSQYRFSDAAGARQAVNNAFENKLIGSGQNGVAPPRTIGEGTSATNPAEVFTALQRSMSPEGQGTLIGYIRGQGYGAPGASREALEALDATYRGNGIDLLRPDERDFFNINLRGRGYTSPDQIPQNDPFKLNPFAGVSEGKGFKGVTTPLKNAAIGALTGTTMGGGPVSGAVGGVLGLFGTPSISELTSARNWRLQQSGAPGYMPNVPDLRTPLATGIGIAQPPAAEVEENLNTQGANFFGAPQRPAPTAPTPAAPAPATPPQRTYNRPSAEEGMSDINQRGADFFGSQEDIDRRGAEFFGTPQPQYRGGRTAYKTGGAVGSIEPLVRNLVNKAGMVKKMSNKETEPLLNEHDNAIASALEVAQRAI